jgi:hypothetical protein
MDDDSGPVIDFSNSTTNSTASIPPLLPPGLALLCAIVAGLTSFGDAILYHILWSICVVGGLVPGDRAALIKAVIFVTIMPLSSMPLSLYVSRAKWRQCFIFAAVMASTGMSGVPIGASLLFAGDLTWLKIGVGSFFLLFSAVKITLALLSRNARPSTSQLEPAAAPTGPAINIMAANGDAAVADNDVAVNPVQADEESGTAALAGAASTTSVDDRPLQAQLEPADTQPPPFLPGQSKMFLMPRRTSAERVESAANGHSTVHNDMTPAAAAAHKGGRCWGMLEPISPKYGVRATLGILLVAGLVAGILGGLYGTSGPPMMTAFALLALDKDTIRGLASLYMVFELGVRIYSFTSAAGFDAADAPVYGGVIVASWVGFSTGTYARRWADTATVVFILLCLVYASSSILLGALDNSSIAIGFAVGTAVWLAAIAAVRWWRRRSNKESAIKMLSGSLKQ